jgi:SAM-dependent methyltransferase
MYETAEELRAQLCTSIPPVPPRELRAIVSGPEEEGFLREGIDDITLSLTLYERHALDRPARPRVLDFGCGCARLTRYLDGCDRYETFACDLNPQHVAWCRENLPRVTTLRNGRKPPLPFAANSFHFAYALSVVTHLPERASLAWLADLARVLRPDGVALITTHGYPCLATVAHSVPHQQMLPMTGEQARQIAASLPRVGHAFVPYAPNVVKIANVGIDYGLSFTDPDHARIKWSRFFESIEHIPGALRGWQDVHVLRRRDRPASLISRIFNFARRPKRRHGGGD